LRLTVARSVTPKDCVPPKAPDSRDFRIAALRPVPQPQITGNRPGLCASPESWLSLVQRPGWLRLRGGDSLFSRFRQSLMARRVQHFQFTVETRLEFSPTHYTQMAGLICYYDTRQHFYLRVTHDETLGKVVGVVLTDDGAYDEPANSRTPINDWSQIFLRAAVDGKKLQFSASPDGKTWHDIGPVLDFSKLSDDYGSTLRFAGAMVGLCAQDLNGTHAVADFDYFAYRPEKS
jgi:xylan 1,4-beta-xylosidase